VAQIPPASTWNYDELKRKVKLQSSALVGRREPEEAEHSQFSECCSPLPASTRKPNTPGRNRTCDTRFRKAVLYPLSYEGEKWVEPRSGGLQQQCDEIVMNQAGSESQF
jgi:hypothetical protein